MKCKRHPTYKAIRKPTAYCPTCEIIWAKKQRRKPLRLRDVEFNLTWVRRRAKEADDQFRADAKTFAHWANECGCKAHCRTLLNNMMVSYDNYHAFLAVASMIEEGTP